jgi:hypothetical protein
MVLHTKLSFLLLNQSQGNRHKTRLFVRTMLTNSRNVLHLAVTRGPKVPVRRLNKLVMAEPSQQTKTGSGGKISNSEIFHKNVVDCRTGLAVGILTKNPKEGTNHEVLDTAELYDGKPVPPDSPGQCISFFDKPKLAFEGASGKAPYKFTRKHQKFLDRHEEKILKKVDENMQKDPEYDVRVHKEDLSELKAGSLDEDKWNNIHE